MLNKLSVSALALLIVGSSIAQDKADPPKESPKQEAPAVAGKRTLTTEDYKNWERLGRVSITNDGRFLSWQVQRVDGDVVLNIRKVDGPERAQIPNSGNAEFSDNSKWAAYTIALPKAELDKLAEQGRPVPTKLGIRNLETGEERIIEDIQRFEFLKDSELIVATRAKTTPGPGGNDLLIFNPAAGEPTVISNVVSYVATETEKIIALKIASGTGYNALQVFNPASGITRTLYSGKDDVVTFDWAKDADVLAAAIARVNEKKKGNTHRILRFAGIAQDSISRQELDPDKFEGFPKETRISEFLTVQLSKDGSSVLFGVQNWSEKSKPVNPKDQPSLQIWNSKDLRPIPEQARQAGADRARSALYLWRPTSNKLVNVTGLKDGEVPHDEVSTALSPDHRYAYVNDGLPYASATTNGVNYRDIYVANLETGEKTMIVKKSRHPFVRSQSGRYATYYQNKTWVIFDGESKTQRVLKTDGKINFEDALDDRSLDEKGPAEFPIWLADDTGLILQDNFDAWLVNPSTGGMTKLTDGRKENLRFRLEDVTPYEETPKLSSSLYFTMFDTQDKKMGYFISDGKGGGKTALFDDAYLTRLTKAKDADRMTFVMESWQKSPDVFVTNEAMTAAKPLTKTNPQQKDFHWGKTEIVQFKSKWGAPLQGMLVYPANYDPKKKYPMVTYIYERLSDEKNMYENPVEWSAYNLQHFSQNGYFVFQPDITYRPGKPGESALQCLEPAVDAALKQQPAIDAKKVGLIGHSWGAYQTAYVTTVSDRFAIGACGAPLTELTSMYNSFYWNAGITNQVLFESGQGRMRVPFWEDPKSYIDQSPVWQASKRKIPLLMAFGDNDGAVDWHQGQYLYNTLRRMGKECVLLVYAGENHNFRMRPQQLDYAKRMRHWLDVYLKGAKPEPWISEGVPYIKQTDK
jgi:dienelactone hydrolase